MYINCYTSFGREIEVIVEIWVYEVLVEIREVKVILSELEDDDFGVSVDTA